MFAEQENKRMEKEEIDRKQEFAKIKEFQERNDAKYQLYSDYIGMDNRE